MTPLRQSCTSFESVRMAMPGARLVAQPIWGRGIQLMRGRPSGPSSGFLSGPILGVPSSMRHMRQLPTTWSLGW